MNGYKFSFTAPKRKTYVQHLQQRFRMDNMMPIIKTVKLDGDDPPEAKVVCFNFKETLKSLLLDEELMQPENLMINADDPFTKYESPDGMIDDVLSGYWYHKTYDTMVQISDRKFVCPLILFADKTHIDSLGRFGVFPVSYTLDIFKRRVRANPKAWRHLGFVHDTYQSAYKKLERKKVEIGRKCRNLHFQLHAILGSLIEVHHGICGIPMKLQIKNYIKEVLVRVPIAFIVGDCEGNDKLCGKYSSHSLGTGRISRACSCPPENADDPYHICPLNLQKEMYKFIQDSNHSQLKSVAVHKHDNVFFKLNFGYNKHGTYFATHADMMHAFQSGVMKYVMEVFVNQLTVKKENNLNSLLMEFLPQLRQHG